jgi:hypothetical protein
MVTSSDVTVAVKTDALPPIKPIEIVPSTVPDDDRLTEPAAEIEMPTAPATTAVGVLEVAVLEADKPNET